jgi:hypothetical protein
MKDGTTTERGSPKIYSFVRARSKPPSDNLNPALQSWIANCLVPILVEEFLEQRKLKAQNTRGTKGLASVPAGVRDSAP